MDRLRDRDRGPFRACGDGKHLTAPPLPIPAAPRRVLGPPLAHPPGVFAQRAAQAPKGPRCARTLPPGPRSLPTRPLLHPQGTAALGYAALDRGAYGRWNGQGRAGGACPGKRDRGRAPPGHRARDRAPGGTRPGPSSACSSPGRSPRLTRRRPSAARSAGVWGGRLLAHQLLGMIKVGRSTLGSGLDRPEGEACSSSSGTAMSTSPVGCERIAGFVMARKYPRRLSARPGRAGPGRAGWRP